MKSSLALFAFWSSISFAGDVLMIDLNNSVNEDAACLKGVKAANSKDSVVVVGEHVSVDGKVVDGDRRIQEIIQRNLQKKKIAYEEDKLRVTGRSIESLMTELESAGYSFDSIVISGHDGSGHFFGANGKFLSSDLKSVIQNHPKLKESLNTMALWGCYTTTAGACQNFWMKNMSPNIKAAVGFTLQSPDNTRPGNWDLLEDYCKKREKVAEAATEQERNEVFNGLKGIRNWNAGICFRDALCSADYAQVGEKNPSCVHTYDELYRRCKDFDPSEKQIQMFEKYMAAKDSHYANPPPDGESEFTSMGINANVRMRSGELRKFYGQLHLWRHCADLLKRDTGYVMPLPAQVIRLTKFETLKNNFEKIHHTELHQYNERLRKLGLNQFTLDGLGKMSRQEIVASTEGAVTTLNQMANGQSSPGQKDRRIAPKINGVDTAALLVMARGFDLSLRQLDFHCTGFALVHEVDEKDFAAAHSLCIKEYGETPVWPE